MDLNVTIVCTEDCFCIQCIAAITNDTSPKIQHFIIDYGSSQFESLALIRIKCIHPHAPPHYNKSDGSFSVKNPPSPQISNTSKAIGGVIRHMG